MTPMPPAWAIAIAMRASVTVSMADAMIGMLSGIARVIWLRMSASEGSTSERPGCSRTSSKVSASRGLPFDPDAMANSPRLIGTAGVKRRFRPAHKAKPATQDPVVELAPVVSTAGAGFKGPLGRGRHAAGLPPCFKPICSDPRDLGRAPPRGGGIRRGVWLVIALAIAAASWPTASGAQPSPPAAKPVPASPPAAPKPKSPQRVPAPSAVPAGDAKVIKRPAEYNAYIAALNLADPVRKAAAMEAFIIKYPASVVKIDALEQAMAAYQAAGNVTQVEDAANRILMTQPRNVRALAIVTFLRRARATQGDAKALADMPGGAE